MSGIAPLRTPAVSNSKMTLSPDDSGAHNNHSMRGIGERISFEGYDSIARLIKRSRDAKPQADRVSRKQGFLDLCEVKNPFT